MKTESIRLKLLFTFIPVVHLCYGQDTIKKLVNFSDTVDLRLAWTSNNYGNIQWQRSTDGINWTALTNQNSKDYVFGADTSAFYRAKITAGTCEPVYSKISELKVLNLKAKVDNITANYANISGSISTYGTFINEHGILFDSIPSLNPELTKKADTSSTWQSLKYSFLNLTPGKTYYARLYVYTSSGSYILGNSIEFTTINVSSLDRIDFTDTSARVWYNVLGSAKIDEHGVFINTKSDVDTSSLKIQGSFDSSSSKILGIIMGNKRCFVDLPNLKSGASYFIRPYLKSGSTLYFDEVQKITTLLSYSEEIVDTSRKSVSHTIVWNDQSTSRKLSVSFGDYGRVKRIGNSDTLLLVYHGGPRTLDWINIYMRKSFDNGNTWENEEIIRNINNYSGQYYRFCNPDLLVLKNGIILLAYEANAAGNENNSSIQLLSSNDHGKTWQGPAVVRTGRSWEPALLELPHGEIEMFYSCEAIWWPSIDGSYVAQEICEIYSSDNGKTWSSPKTVAFYPGKRDGMPVPLLLQGNKGVAFAIETVDNSNSPYIIYRPLKDAWTLTTSNFDNSPYRWFAGSFQGHGGAPYIIQLPSGETVLSAHRYRSGDWHQNNELKVMIGDNNAKNFSQLSTPYTLSLGESAVNNSLFLKNDTTIVAISCRMMSNGTGGIYWLEGKIKNK